MEDDVTTPVDDAIDDESVGDDGVAIDDDVVDDEGVEMEPIDPTNPDYIRTAQRRYGGLGAVMAAGMFGLEQAMGIKPKPESVQIQEAPSDPIDVDKDGIQMTIDATTSVHAPALDRRSPIGLNKKRSRRG